jgi:arylsulfatase A-like enzyme
MYWKTGQEYAVREGNWKLIVNRSDNEVELYNLENDFRETRNRSKSDPEKTQQLIELLERFKKDDR